MSSKVFVFDEIRESVCKDWDLCLQRVRYVHPDRNQDGYEEGFRFINRHEDKLQAQRGQARIPSFAAMRRLMQRADAAGWGHYEADPNTFKFGA